ncbi:MAG TPA: FAD-dependent oxidoreductase [Peptococcaceae bacterium]|nr:MAG: FAD dependent oxidoreductase [Clostridia bacterium 41_269]HBT19862.1 FAD-dependent oxidoreductase [Peptococcaceae bacterium]
MNTRSYDVIIVGTGPAGIFTAIELCRNTENLRIAMFEKGGTLEERICPLQMGEEGCKNCSPCVTVSGWGGAGAFSDGKLTLSPDVGGMLDQYMDLNKMKDLIDYVDSIYIEFGAPEKVYGIGQEEEIEEIRRKAVLAQMRFIHAPVRHMGTGRTKDILKNMRDYLLKRGVKIYCRKKVERIITEKNRAAGVVTSDGEQYRGRYIICAPGREGAQWLLNEGKRLGISMAVNPVDIGVRVEVPAEIMKHITDVVYESKFIFYSQTFDDKVRTFCMNPNGEVVLEHMGDLVTVNGHTHAERKTNNTNFALLVSKTFTEPFKEPIAYGEYIGRLANLLGESVLVQRLGDLLAGRRTTWDRLKKSPIDPTLTEATPGDISLVFPYRHLVAIIEMLRALDVVAPGVYSKYTLLYGVEVKFYSSRFEVNNFLETKIKNLYTAGDGAGITRGLIQASISGIVIARDILKKEEIF